MTSSGRGHRPTLFPDPIVTANIYCRGLLDQLLYGAIAPFWQRFRDRDPEGACYLWVSRYFRCGEHLKIRLHGPRGFKAAMRQELTAAVETFFTTLERADDEPKRGMHEELHPLDVEDEASEPYTDRTLLWTHYRRIPGTMGREPLSDDVQLAALFTLCLSRGTDIILDEIHPGPDGNIPYRLRSSLVLKFLVAGLASLPLRDDQRLDYLAYHRDWLTAATESDHHGLLERFDRKIQADPSTLQSLRQTFESQKRISPEEQPDPRYRAWQRSFAELFAHVLKLSGGSGFESSLHLRDQVLAPVFKILHGLANQVQVGIFNEAFLAHLLRSALGSAA